MTQVSSHPADSARYARCIEASRRVRWDTDRDVIRGRGFDFSRKFMPDGLSRVDRLAFLGADEQRRLSQIQGRTYANMFALVERFIGAKVLDISRNHWLGDQVALEALVRLADEELKHQALFRRLDGMMAVAMPAGYRFLPEPDGIAQAVLGCSTWAVLALTCDIEIFSQVHYLSSIEPEADIDPLWKDVFFFHWREESQHAILDEMEWRQEDARLDPARRDEAVGQLIELIAAVDGICRIQAAADAGYFAAVAGRRFDDAEDRAIGDALLAAYRWQYVVSGAQDPRFVRILSTMIDAGQGERIGAALAPVAAAVH